jgi:ribosomal protein L7/L12
MVVLSGAVSLTVSTHFTTAATANTTTTAAADASVDASADNNNVCLESGASHKLAVIKAGEVFPAHVSSGSLLL